MYIYIHISKMGPISVQNGPYLGTKWALSRYKMGPISVHTKKFALQYEGLQGTRKKQYI